MTSRPDYILHEIPVHEWTEEEVFTHLRNTFDRACSDFPDVMESYVVRYPDWEDQNARKTFMRQALRETFPQRRYFRIPARQVAE